jgi:hypothetical protein
MKSKQNYSLLKVVIVFSFLLKALTVTAQTKPGLSVSGTAGVWYEGYGLDLNTHSTPIIYAQRRPWNLVRFSFQPIVTMGKFSMPLNFNFSPMQNNFITPSIGGVLPGGVLAKQSFWQFLTNPMNSFGAAPEYKSLKVLLGTQYIKYSNLSTGDLGIFGYGINLSPGKFRFKFFNGVSQRAVNYLAAVIPYPGSSGAYQRNHWMAQVGLEKEGKYFVGFNFVKSKDKASSVTPTPLPSLINPQNNMIVTFVANTTSSKGWIFNLEVGQSFHTRNELAAPAISPLKDYQPFINQNITTSRDNAFITGITKKGKDWEIGGKVAYYGAGYYTAGYQFLSSDRLEYSINTRFNAWKKKTNVVASIGQRFGNWNYTSGPNRTKQIIANANVFTQFNDHFSMNISYNNFGFNAPSITGYKSVSNELSANPTYMWSNTSMSHLISGTYTWSKYDETNYTPLPVYSNNNTHTALLLYVPTFFNKKISPDFSLMWFKNTTIPASSDLTLWSATIGLGWPVTKKLKLKNQLQYNSIINQSFSANKNLMAIAGFDWQIKKKLSWQYTMNISVLRFGSEKPGSSLTPAFTGIPQYMESTLRTGLQYRW